MERIQSLINQLYQQNLQGANNSQLLVTVQLLELELLKAQERARPVATSKVAVTLPSRWKGRDDGHAAYMPPVPPRVEEPVWEEETAIEAAPPAYNYKMDQGEKDINKGYAVSEVREEENKYQPLTQKVNTYIHETDEFFHTEIEAPTLIQHRQGKELNEIIAHQKESLNERLKQEKEEIGNVLKEVPIKDLRKGIGINDRFRFLSELFRNDEAMYERSIKTINNFKVFSEAEYWITRELRYKLGWDENKDTVQHFYQLVRRRFS